MEEMAKHLIGKDCIIHTFSDSVRVGVLQEVKDGALLIEENGRTEIINLQYVISMKEIPLNSKGKRKAIY